MRRWFGVLAILPGIGAGQVVPGSRGTESAGMGGVVSVLQSGVWQAWNNPARLPRSFAGGAVAYNPGMFGLDELQRASCVAGMGLQKWSWALMGERFGSGGYTETTGGVACAVLLAEGFSTGLALRFTRLTIDRYGGATVPLVDGGVYSMLHERLSMGWVVKNILGATIGNLKEPVAQVAAVGFRYLMADPVSLVLEAEKDIRYPAVFKGGLAFRPVEGIILRIGTSSQPDVFSAGMEIGGGPVVAGYGGQWHPLLGWTHQGEMQWRVFTSQD